MSELGWYFETVEGWTTLLKDVVPYFDWDSRGLDGIPTNDQQAELLSILNAHEPMLAALKEIARGELVMERVDLGKPSQGTTEERRRWRVQRIAKAAIAAAKGGG